MGVKLNPWSDAEVETLKKLVASEEKLTAKAIGERLGRSKNAIIAKLQALNGGRNGQKGVTLSSGLARSQKSTKRKALPTPRPKITGKTVANPSVSPYSDPTPMTPERDARMNEPLAASVPVRFLRRKANQCCWPLGDPKSPDFRCCGATAEIGGSYCSGHKAIAYRPSRRAA